MSDEKRILSFYLIGFATCLFAGALLGGGAVPIALAAIWTVGFNVLVRVTPPFEEEESE